MQKKPMLIQMQRITKIFVLCVNTFPRPRVGDPPPLRKYKVSEEQLNRLHRWSSHVQSVHYNSFCRSINICLNRDGAVLLPGVLNAEWLKYMTKWVEHVDHVWIGIMKVSVFQNSDKIIGQGSGGQSVQPLSWLHPLSPTWWGFESISAMIIFRCFVFPWMVTMVLSGVYSYHQFDNWIASAG